MSVGDGALISGFSYLAVGRELTFGTYNTATAGMDFLSCSLKTTKDNKILEQVERSRSFSKVMSLSKMVEGDLEFYFQPRLDACGFLLQNAFGGTITSATATGETAGAGANSAMDHTFNIGSMDQSYPSLCLNLRKGPVTAGKVFEYSGVRIDEISFEAAIDEPLKATCSFVCKDSSITSNDVESVSGIPTTTALSFVDGRLSIETSFASLTSSSYWQVHAFTFGWANSLKKDASSRRIGSDVLQVLPPGMTQYTFSATVRFDTTTAYSAMLNATQLSAQLEFLGPTLPSSSIRQKLRFNLPKVFVSDAGDPEIGGPDDLLTSEITFHVLRDDSSATGYAVQAILTNNKASYA